MNTNTSGSSLILFDPAISQVSALSLAAPDAAIYIFATENSDGIDWSELPHSDLIPRPISLRSVPKENRLSEALKIVASIAKEPA